MQEQIVNICLNNYLKKESINDEHYPECSSNIKKMKNSLCGVVVSAITPKAGIVVSNPSQSRWTFLVYSTP